MEYNLNIVINPTSTGTLEIDGVPSSGSVSVTEGDVVSLEAIPEAGWKFDRFILDYSPLPELVVANPHSFTMPSEDVELTVEFVEDLINPIKEADDIFDTPCPRFLFVKDYEPRHFAGDTINLTGHDYTELIDEPVDFDSGKFNLERDLVYHGFNYEYSVDSLQYERGSIGYNFLKDTLYTTGTDSDVKFIYGFGNLANMTVIYIGTVDFNEYEEIEDGDYVAFSLRELDFDNLLQTSFDVPQKVSPDQAVLLHSRVIPKKVTYNPAPDSDETLSSTAWFGTEFYVHEATIPAIFKKDSSLPVDFQPKYDKAFLYINDGKTGDDSLEATPSYDFQIIGNELGDPKSNESYFIKAKEAGQYQIQIRNTFGLKFTEPSFFSAPYPMQLVILKVAKNGNIISSNKYDPIDVEVFSGLLYDLDVELTFSKDLDIQLDYEESLYIYYEFDTLGGRFPNMMQSGASNPIGILKVLSLPYKFEFEAPAIEMVAQTVAPTSLANFSKPLDLLDGIMRQAVESNIQVVKSSFFDEEGCGEKLFITNGFNVRGGTKLRNVTEENTSLKVSPKSIIDMLVSVFNLGFGVEYGDNNEEMLRIEPTSYFYQDVEIMAFDSVSDYSKRIDTSKYYNEIEVGFTKYSKGRETEKANTLDDFHTNHVYQTPIKKNKNKLSILSDLILSGYELEILRRKQFLDDGTNENSNFSEDEDLFGVFVVDTTPFTGNLYNTFIENNFSTHLLGTIDPYSVGSKIRYTGGGVTNMTRTIERVEYNSGITIVHFVEPIPAPSTEPFISIFVIGDGYIQPETLQELDVDEGLVSPSTVYNLRITPKRMLQNWGNLINGGFFTKSGVDKLVFKQGDGNTQLKTTYKNGSTCMLGDLDRQQVYEGGDIIIGDGTVGDTQASMMRGEFLFLPISISFSTPLNFTQLIDLKKCLRGQEGSKDYGYISVTNPCEVVEKVYITSIKYNPVKEEAEIVGYLKEIA